jgi:hypothetical protein
MIDVLVWLALVLAIGLPLGNLVDRHFERLDRIERRLAQLNRDES